MPAVRSTGSGRDRGSAAGWAPGRRRAGVVDGRSGAGDWVVRWASEHLRNRHRIGAHPIGVRLPTVHMWAVFHFPGDGSRPSAHRDAEEQER